MANGRNMAPQVSGATVAQMVSSGVRAERHMTIRSHGFPCLTMYNTAEIEGGNLDNMGDDGDPRTRKRGHSRNKNHFLRWMKCVSSQ